MNKEVQEILNILKCYNNTIQTKFVSVIFENLKLKYELPPIYHKSIDLTCFSKIFEIDNKLYEFFFYFNDSDSEKVIIFFHKIKEVNEIKEDLEYLKNYFNDDKIHAKLQQILNNLTNKTKDSKGNIYDSCPYIDEIISTIDNQLSFYNDEPIKISIKSNLEIIRKINQELRNLRDKKIQELEEKIQSFQEISDKYEIVNDLLGIDAKDLRWVKHNTQDIADKLKRLEKLEKENEELKKEINNLTTQNNNL